jgi:ABC-type transport system involved in multi-copper enzyme maturation permease subunit
MTALGLALRTALEHPNPVWMREMRQSARLSRTPIILALLTILTTLVIAAVGGVGASNSDPATVGAILFHTFFSLGYAIVTWIGPGVAAMTIASERSGRTWETVLLTGMSARQVARGKFASAFTYIAMYVVMLAPVGALSFLFGGVSALDVTLAFLYLFLFAALSVGFGLSISSAINNPTVAMLVTVPIAAVLSLGVYLILGVALSMAVHSYWPGVAQGAPVWLPTAYTRADFGWLYVLLLVATPLTLAGVVGWLFYELTAANIAQQNDDRSSGLRRWFAVVTPLLVLVFLIPRTMETNRDDMWQSFVLAMGATQCFLGVVLFLVAGEPLARSPRVEWAFRKSKASRLRKFLGPGIERALLLVLMLGGVALVSLVAAGVWQEHLNHAATGLPDPARVACVLSFGGYALCFLLFLTGFVLYVRARSQSGAAPRVLFVLVVFVANAGPWLVLAMAGMLARVHEVMWLAAPSPAFVFQLFDSLLASVPGAQTQLFAMIVSATSWALLGVLFWGLGSRALRRRLLAERRERARDSEQEAAT